MSRMNNQILLVGSIPGDDAREAMKFCGEGLGGLIDCLPDGETGQRRIWINYLAANTYDGNAGLQTINRPVPVDPKHPEEWREPHEGWAPRGYEDHWQFARRPGTETIYFENLGYSDSAKSSYADFCDLRDEGVIDRQTRFMVALPLIESAIRPFIANAEDFDLMWAAYEEALQREVVNLTDCIPANDLVIQWDVCMEVVAVEVNDEHAGIFPWKPETPPMERYLRAITKASSHVPERVLMGLHLCYGDLGHRHLVEPANLSVVTQMAEAAIAAVPRTIDYFHMPVPRDRFDDAYFEPLDTFDPQQGKLYLGLVHHTGGASTSMRLLETAKNHATGFGIATECGFGRRPRDTLPALLSIHREIAARL